METATPFHVFLSFSLALSPRKVQGQRPLSPPPPSVWYTFAYCTAEKPPFLSLTLVRVECLLLRGLRSSAANRTWPKDAIERSDR